MKKTASATTAVETATSTTTTATTTAAAPSGGRPEVQSIARAASRETLGGTG